MNLVSVSRKMSLALPGKQEINEMENDRKYPERCFNKQ